MNKDGAEKTHVRRGVFHLPSVHPRGGPSSPGQRFLKSLKSHCPHMTMCLDSPSQPYPGSQEWPQRHRPGLTQLPVDVGGLFPQQKLAVLGLQAVCADLGIGVEHTPQSTRAGLQSGDLAGLVTGTL